MTRLEVLSGFIQLVRHVYVVGLCDLFNHCKFKYMSVIILLPSVGFGVAHAQLRTGTHNFLY